MLTPPTDPSAASGSSAAGSASPSRRTVLGAMAATAATVPGLLALGSPASAAPAADPLPGGGDLGPNVIVFDPSTSGIQAKLDEIFKQQESAQFGTGRYAFLFKPGTYNGLNAQLGFYTSIAGLGLSPDDTAINGDVTVDAGWFNGNATQNFWRSAENLALTPVNGTNRWAVAQAAPFRRMHVRGGLNLAPDGYGWASGGYIADSRIDGTVGPYSQQQWYTRDSSVGGWTNAVWNMVFSGVEGAPAQSFPDPPYTTLDTTPVSREKPFLYLDGADYKVFLPEKRTDARGTTWGGGTPRGTSLALTQFYVAKPGVTAATLNAALDQGLNLLLTPGIYHLDAAMEVKRANAVVLGLGYATLIPDNGVTAVKVADVDGVRLAGFLIDAGAVNSQTLLEVGPSGASTDHSANPVRPSQQVVEGQGDGAGDALAVDPQPPLHRVHHRHHQGGVDPVELLVRRDERADAGDRQLGARRRGFSRRRRSGQSDAVARGHGVHVLRAASRPGQQPGTGGDDGGGRRERDEPAPVPSGFRAALGRLLGRHGTHASAERVQEPGTHQRADHGRRGVGDARRVGTRGGRQRADRAEQQDAGRSDATVADGDESQDHREDGQHGDDAELQNDFVVRPEIPDRPVLERGRRAVDGRASHGHHGARLGTDDGRRQLGGGQGGVTGQQSAQRAEAVAPPRTAPAPDIPVLARSRNGETFLAACRRTSSFVSPTMLEAIPHAFKRTCASVRAQKPRERVRPRCP
ncbi:hypothetical protein ACFC96_08805 [Streptomyces sp. NPDC055955]|uniref:hypothetical protein n=1 Tax=Streptomyces sp. NPDC055955 TaxID=3345665 RepID=UPI0035D7A424